jgi:cytochrome c5
VLRLALATVLLATAACVTPALPLPDQQADAGVPTDAPDNCEVRVENVGDGHHNPGTACLECHNGQAAGAPVFTLAGTVYKDAAGTIPKTHATVIVYDGDGNVVKLPTAANGNFYTQAALAPPYFTAVSQCPATAPMAQNFSDGDCNSCHSGAASPGRILFAE